MHKWLDLENKVVIVTGGTSGIGQRMCQSFMEQGAQVVIADLCGTRKNGKLSFYSL